MHAHTPLVHPGDARHAWMHYGLRLRDERYATRGRVCVVRGDLLREWARDRSSGGSERRSNCYKASRPRSGAAVVRGRREFMHRVGWVFLSSCVCDCEVDAA